MKKLVSLMLMIALMLCLVPTAGAASTTFPDVKPGAWHYAEVTELAQGGYILGYPDGTFKPNGLVTAAEFVTIVTRRAGVGEASSSLSHWAAGRMQAALNLGWYDWDEFPPVPNSNYNKPITRQVAVKILMKAFLPNAQGDYNTASKQIRDFSQLDGRYYDAVFAAYMVGVVTGYPNGDFKPKGSLTRAEACALVVRATRLAGTPSQPGGTTTPTATPTPTSKPIGGGVTENGKLQVSGTQLCNKDGKPVVLRGMSTHGMQWYDQYASSNAIRNTAKYGANLFRVAMYTGENGYLSQPEAIKKKVIAAVDAAIANDMYVIIDWHILSDGNPMSHLPEAKAFFAEMAKKYKNEPAVLYEICNEPNGNVSWSKDVKPYATQLVKTIRDAGSDGVILIGSPTWSQDIHLAADDPVQGKNLMYTLHFYAGTHGQWLRDRIDQALGKGLPVFVSEWGTSAADGNGGVYLNESKTWLDYLNKKGISWANWSLCDKGESSAALKGGTSPSATWSDKDLSESGKFVFSRFKG